MPDREVAERTERTLDAVRIRRCKLGIHQRVRSTDMSDERRCIGSVSFTDGTERQAFEDALGRQYVEDNAGRWVEGQWLPPADRRQTLEESRSNDAK
jgi:hypothetical protein